MAMRLHSAWIPGILLLAASAAVNVFAEDSESAPTPAIQFVAPVEAPASTKATAAQDSGNDATFINPENAEAEKVIFRNGKKVPASAQNAAELNQTVLKKVQKKATKDLPKLNPNADDPAAENELEAATNAAFAPGQGQNAETAAAGDTNPGSDPKGKVDEKGPAEVVKGGFSAANPAGVLKFFKDKKNLKDYSYSDAVKQAINQNLNKKFAQTAYERSDYAITRAKAAFDPIFSLTLNGTQTDTYERREFINRRRFIAGELQNEIVDAIFNTTTAQEPNDPVEGFERRGAFERAGSRARFRSETITESFGKQLPWGSIFSLAFTQKHSKTIFQEFTTEDSFTINDSETGLDANGQVQPILDSDGINQRKRSVFFEQHGRFARNRQQRPWSSSLNVRLVVPLPYTKDWGGYGPAEVPIKLTEAAHQRAYWDLQSTINNTLLGTTLNYWNLVRAVRRLELTIKTRQGLEKVLGVNEEMFKKSTSTIYDLNQIKQQIASIRRGEQGEWANYVVASNALKNVIDEDKDTVILPVAYGELLTVVPPASLEESFAAARSLNPELKSAQVGVDLAEISLKFAKNQALPDLKLTTGMSWFQSSANYGYSGVGPSMAALMRPDQRDSFMILNYRVPWGNKPALERVNEAEERYKQAVKTQQLTLNSIDRRVQDSVNGVNGARERAELAEKNKDLADNLYKTVLQLAEIGRVPNLSAGNPTFEIINKNTDVLNAGFRAIDAQVDLKQQEAQWLAARGDIGIVMANLNFTLKPLEEKKDEKKEDKKEQKKDEPKKGAENEAGKDPVAPVAAKEQK
jgi:outer membrane protein TolC